MTEEAMKVEVVLEKLSPWRKKHEKTYFSPEVIEDDGEISDSKFCGTPFLSPGNEWPQCKNCHKQMQLFLQLNLDKLPEELENEFGSGLLQLFYCTRDDCQGEGGWEPFEDKLSSVRIIEANGIYSPPAILHEQQEEYPAFKIIGWERGVDHPSSEEHDLLGLIYDYISHGPTMVKCPEFGFDSPCVDDGELAETIASAADGDKLGGWPYWVQGVEYPSCTECGETMRLLFQVDSEVNIPFMFGDSGCGHITQCKTHKDVVAFGWACS